MSMKSFTLCAVAVLALTAITSVAAHGYSHNHGGHNGRSLLAEQAHILAHPPQFPEGSITCGSCNVLVDVIYEISATNATRSEAIALLDAACVKEFPNSPTLCEDIVKLAVDELPKIVKAIYQLGYNTSYEVCSCLDYCKIECCLTPTVPEQVHINWFGPLTQMSVAWTTLNTTATSRVLYGTDPNNLNLEGQDKGQWTYTRGGWVGVLHQALMTGLSYNTTYYYQVGDSAGGWSETLFFTTLEENPTTLSFATIGDMGSDWNSDATVKQLIADVEAGVYHAVIHNGDISYADGNEKNWDIFLRKLQPVASRVPYMTTAGNHELWWNFTAYKARFGAVMPYAESGSSNPLYYSFNLGDNFHFVGFNTETPIDTADVDPVQSEWLKNDLGSAASQNARWRIAFAHRPVYCANNDKLQCTTFPAVLQAQTEDIFRDYNVALVLTAHEHNYQRTYPVYKTKVTNTSYDNPTDPTYLVNGAGGNREGETKGFWNPLPEWMAHYETDTGYGRLEVTLPAINFQFVDNIGPTIKDSFSITKP